MRSSRFARFGAGFLIISIAFGVFYGCGRKIDRQLSNKALEYFSQNQGCLNDFGKRAEHWIKGDILPAEWEKSCDCLAESMRLFKRYIRGSDPEGYTAEDLQSFSSRFLITNAKLKVELVEATFELKASLIGGRPDLLTYKELERFIALLSIVKRETTRLVPHLLNRVEDPTPENLSELSKAVTAALTRFGAELSTKGNLDFTQASAKRLIEEMGSLFGWDITSESINWISSIKGIALGGDPAKFEADRWKEAFEVAGRLGGPALALSSQETFDRSLTEFLLERARDTLHHVIENHDKGKGKSKSIPLSRFDHLVDNLPASFDKPDRAVLKRALRPIVVKVFGSKSDDALDSGAIDRIFEVLLVWNRRQLHIDRIFEKLNADPSGIGLDELLKTAQAYQKGMSAEDKAHVQELSQIARKFRPLYVGEDPQISFSRWNRISRFHLSQMSWIRIAAQQLLKTYGDQITGDRINMEGFNRFWDDYADLGWSLGSIDITVPDYRLKRFREANLFTYVSNGDELLDLDEANYFLAFMFSSSVLFERLKSHLEKTCTSLGPDPMGGNYYDLKCFRKEYFSEFATFWDHFPGLITHYQNLAKEEDRQEIRNALEMAARPYGLTDEPISTTDLQGFATTPHYLEALMERVDENGDQRVNLAEAMKVFPTFKKFLAEVGQVDPSDEGQLEAIYTYTIKHRRPPSRSAWGVTHFLSWRAIKPFWKLDADRNSIYATIGALNDPKSVKDPEENSSSGP